MTKLDTMRSMLLTAKLRRMAIQADCDAFKAASEGAELSSREMILRNRLKCSLVKAYVRENTLLVACAKLLLDNLKNNASGDTAWKARKIA